LEDWLRFRPTPEQYRMFGDHLCEAHSWYKHLPLMSGRRFVVFVAPDAGIGRLVAVLHGSSPEAGYPTRCTLVTPPEGPEFTDAHPRIHYGWKTTREYRTRFGHLDYMRRQSPEESYDRDAGPPVELPAEVEERCGFVLYPYVSWEFAEAVIWSVHADALAALRSGAPHPARDEVLELARLAEALGPAWNALGEPERDWVLAFEGEEPLPGEPSGELYWYLEIDGRIQTIAKSLHDREVSKIRLALTALDDWLQSGR
jgi:hypothetical protein